MILQKKTSRNKVPPEITMLALATMTEVLYSTQKISDVATKPKIFEQIPVVPKMIFCIFLNLSSPRETRINKTCPCNYNQICSQHKKISDRSTKPTIFEHKPTAPQKQFFLDFS